MKTNNPLKSLTGASLGSLFALVLIWFMRIPFIYPVNYQCSRAVTSTLFVTSLMIFSAFIGWKLSTISFFHKPPFSVPLPTSSRRQLASKKRRSVIMNEINVFEFVSDEELWTEIYGKATNSNVWKSLERASGQELM
jgi:hypothetical protein